MMEIHVGYSVANTRIPSNEFLAGIKENGFT
jgi:hypothetical protein